MPYMPTGPRLVLRHAKMPKRTPKKRTTKGRRKLPAASSRRPVLNRQAKVLPSIETNDFEAVESENDFESQSLARPSTSVVTPSQGSGAPSQGRRRSARRISTIVTNNSDDESRQNTRRILNDASQDSESEYEPSEAEESQSDIPGEIENTDLFGGGGSQSETDSTIENTEHSRKRIRQETRPSPKRTSTNKTEYRQNDSHDPGDGPSRRVSVRLLVPSPSPAGDDESLIREYRNLEAQEDVYLF